MGVPGHRCRWYPISFRGEAGIGDLSDDAEPTLWACGVYWGCTKTVTSKEHDKLLVKARKDDEAKGLRFTGIDMEVPKGGLWGTVD